MAISNLLVHFHGIQYPLLWMFLIISFIKLSVTEDNSENISSNRILPTVTVRGFLNFKTTVDGTVIVFTPMSEPPHPATQPKFTKTSTETLSSSDLPSDAYMHKKILNSQEDMEENIHDVIYASPPQNSLEPMKTQVPDLNIFENKVKNPFLQHISDNAVLPSAGQINNDLDKMRKLLSSQNQYPTGLVTVLGGTFVEGASTTVYETKVIGTYIDGKYAQILQSTSHIVALPSSSFTATPVLNYESRSEERESKELSKNLMKSFSLLPTEETFPVSSSTKEKSSVTPSMITTASLHTPYSLLSSEVISTHSKVKEFSLETKIFFPSTSTKDEPVSSTVISKENRQKSSSAILESSFLTTAETSSYDVDLPTQSLESARISKTNSLVSSLLLVSSTVARLPEEDNTVASVVGTSKNSTSRTRFLSPRRPSQSVRLNRFKVKLTLRHDSTDEYNITLPNDDEELEDDNTTKGEEEVEITSENPAVVIDPAKVVFQQTTITSEVTLHVGRRKSVRTLTITTSIPLTVNPTDIQSILSSQSTALNDDGGNTDPLHQTVSRTYTATERALKTSVVPIFDGKSTMFHTVTESFFIMKIITVYRTLPPGDQTILESYLDEPEISTTTQEIMANTQPVVISSTPVDQLISTDAMQTSVSLLPTGNPHPQLANPLLSLGHALSNNPLAAVYLGLQQLNAQITLYSTITDTSIYVTTETLYNTKTIRFYDGRSTRYRMISDPISTKKSTVTTTITSVQPYINTHALQQQQQLQKLIAATQLSPLQPQFNTITSSYTTVTTATSLSTRIYTLIYNGFSTKFRTVTSTTLYPTTVTITSTTKVPLSPSQVNVPFSNPYPA